MDRDVLHRLALESDLIDPALSADGRFFTDPCDSTEPIARFAQLIAEHCASICEAVPESDEPRDGFYANAIREKFGLPAKWPETMLQRHVRRRE